MNPPKVRDPLTVSSTLSVRKQLWQTGTEGLTELQKQIYNIVSGNGKISWQELTSRLNIPAEKLEHEFSILRHCELLRTFKEGDTVYFAKFSS